MTGAPRSFLGVVLLLAAFLIWRGTPADPGPVPTLVEVDGHWFALVDPTVDDALAAAGHAARGDDRPLRSGERLDLDGLGILPPDDPLLFGRPVDANTASALALESLPGVGPSLAQAWVTDRAEAPFRDLRSLTRIRGLGRSTLKRIAPYIEIGPQDPVDLDTATARDLQSLPGIGPALAERIVEHRAVHGPFRDLRALEAVPGIGPSTRKRIAAALESP